MAAEIGSMYVDFTANTANFAAGMSKAQNIAKAGFGTIQKSADSAGKATDRLAAGLGRKIDGAGYALTARQIASVDAQLQRLTNSVARSQSAFAGFGRLAGGFAASALSAVTFSNIAGAVNETIRSMAALNDQAERLGVNVEDLQAVQFVGRQNGVEAEKLVDLLQKLNLEVGEAQTKGNDLKKIFDANGLKFSADGLVNFRVISELIRNARTEQDKAVIGAAAFGKAYGEAIPFLNLGVEAFKRQEQYARDIGGVIRGDLVKAAAQFDDELQSASDVVSTRLKSGIIAILTDMRGLVAAAEEFGDKLSIAAPAKSAFATALRVNPLTASSMLLYDRYFSGKTPAPETGGDKLLALTEKRKLLEAQIADLLASGNSAGAMLFQHELERLDATIKTLKALKAEPAAPLGRPTNVPAKVDADAIEALMRRIEQPSDLRGIASPNFAGSSTNKLAEIAQINAQLTETRQNLTDVQTYLATLPNLTTEAFGSFTGSVAGVNATIDQTKAKVASLTDEWVKGNIPASQMSVELEKIRDALKKVAGEGDAIDPLVAGLYKALAALPNLKTGLAGLISGLAKAQGIGAISNAGQSFTTTQQNGISVVRGNLNPGANPVIEKNLADLARESRAMHDAIDAAAAEQERQANEAEGQRDSLLDEQRRTTGGIGALSSAIQGLRGDFQSFGTGNPGEFASSGSGGFLQSSYTVLTAIGEAQKTIDSLNAEQGVLQTNIQYRQLTPEQQADAERRLAEISLQIAKLTYFIAQGPTGNPFQSPGFATGGAFKVGGGGGTDSKMVNFLASPSEHVGVYTPDQWDAMIGGGDAQSDNSTVYNYSQTIQTPEVNSFRQARRQLAMDARRQMGGR